MRFFGELATGNPLLIGYLVAHVIESDAVF
jgi:hypothetical protein